MGSAGSYTFDNSQVTGPDPYTSDNAPFLTLNGNQVGLGVPAYADPTLSVTATLTWTPDYPGDLSQPPSPVDVLETVGAGDVAWALQPTGVSTDAKDGFGDPITYMTEPIYGASSSGKHLYHVNAGETTVVLPTRSLSASLSFDTALASSTGGAGVGYTAQIDTRSVALSRDGAHNETVDTDGTVHGDTTYSYGVANQVIHNTQFFHPNFAGGWTPNPNYISGGTGPLFNITWQWTPQQDADTWTSHLQVIDLGNLYAEGTPQQWIGKPDKVKHVAISYTATDLGDSTTAVANYDLSIHDQYDNWRRVDAQGKPMSGSAAGDPGGLDQLGQTTTPLPATPVLTIEDAGTDWNAVGLVGGGVLSGGSIALLGLPDPPTWPIIILGLAGLSVTTVSSLPPPSPHQVSPPGQVGASLLQAAYANYENNLTAPPGEQSSSNLVDAGLANSLGSNPDFQGWYDGDYGTVSITATVYQQMLNYYFYANQYDAGGLVTTTAPSTVHRTGGYVWYYLWTYTGGGASPPGPVQGGLS